MYSNMKKKKFIKSFRSVHKQVKLLKLQKKNEGMLHTFGHDN